MALRGRNDKPSIQLGEILGHVVARRTSIRPVSLVARRLSCASPRVLIDIGRGEAVVAGRSGEADNDNVGVSDRR